nr:sarcolemmal membrane-associated protein-like [Aegilops tauschii subsp. strangulata]
MLHRVPEDQVRASKEALIQVQLMNQRLKEAYNACEALRTNVERSCELGSQYAALENEVLELQVDLEVEKYKSDHLEKEKKALRGKFQHPTACQFLLLPLIRDKDKMLALAQKEARIKTKTAEEELASVGKLEEEIKTLKASTEVAKGEASEWEKKCKDQSSVFEQEKNSLEEKVTQLLGKKGALEQYIEDSSTEMNEKLAKYCSNVELEIENIERDLDPARLVVRDQAALASWKKFAARCGADVALSLVRGHCKDVNEEKLKSLKGANTKKLQFKNFMKTFIQVATRITDDIDLDTFVEPASPHRDE